MSSPISSKQTHQCEICDTTFKTAQSFRSHAFTAKHLKRLKALAQLSPSNSQSSSHSHSPPSATQSSDSSESPISPDHSTDQPFHPDDGQSPQPSFNVETIASPLILPDRNLLRQTSGRKGYSTDDLRYFYNQHSNNRRNPIKYPGLNVKKEVMASRLYDYLFSGSGSRSV